MEHKIKIINSNVIDNAIVVEFNVIALLSESEEQVIALRVEKFSLKSSEEDISKHLEYLLTTESFEAEVPEEIKEPVISDSIAVAESLKNKEIKSKDSVK